MMLPQLLGLVTQPIYLDFVPETKIEQQIEIPPELTLQEKIDSNYYGCNPTRIRADTAECLPDLVYVAPKTVSTSKPIGNSSGGVYEWGWCTYGAKQLAPWVGSWGDARNWDENARRDGHTVSNTPIVGSVFVSNAGRYGHTGVVVGVSGSTITVKDMNYSGFGVWTTRTVSASKYVYIYP